ncbi:aldehyde dehydrogenase family protein (plasmid) [Sinorhizobium chiapasense]|uniref:aldehyde dehydrogenase family protein n=1 Tax=Sinorhizobium chiapasense TaxID=501572 RepID=UPI002FE0FFE9
MTIRELRPLIGESFWSKGTDFDVFEPATGDVIARVPEVGAEGVNAAVAAAKEAFGGWASTPPKDRAAALLAFTDEIMARVDEFAELEARDVGKPLEKARAEMASAADKYRFFAGACRTMLVPAMGEYKPGITSMVRREPIGVVGAISPWNYPMGMTAWRIGPALAAGNTVVLKPTQVTPLTALLLGEVAQKFFPPGVVNIVTGFGSTTGTHLVRHPDVAMVSLTGGTETGRSVMRDAAESIKVVHLELGGKAPVLVFDDANIDRLATTLRSAAFGNSGQDCTAACRVYVSKKREKDVVEALASMAGGIKVGNGYAERGIDMGPVVSAKHHEFVSGFVDRAVRNSSGRVVAGGSIAGPGYFYAPTVVDNVEHSAEIIQKEIFGPVIAVTTFKDEADAIAKANDLEVGLAASIWTSDIERAIVAAGRVKAGSVWINDHGPTAAEMPFGGYKQSGIGRDLSIYAIEAHTELKHIAITHRERI